MYNEYKEKIRIRKQGNKLSIAPGQNFDSKLSKISFSYFPVKDLYFIQKIDNSKNPWLWSHPMIEVVDYTAQFEDEARSCCLNKLEELVTSSTGMDKSEFDLIVMELLRN